MSHRRLQEPHRGLAGPQTTTPANLPASNNHARQPRGPITKPLTVAAQRAQQARRTAREAITARLARILTTDEQRVAEALELRLEGRYTPQQVLDLTNRLRPPDAPPLRPEVAQAFLITLRRQQHLRDALAVDCPPLLRCDNELCAWHRRALKRWWDVRDPIARAFLAHDPATTLAKEQ